MTKLFQAFLTGAFFTFILDFFLFLGMKLNYIDKHNIDLYYNIFFADNQNIFIYGFFTLLIGYLVIYVANTLSLIVVALLFCLSFSTLIPFVGETLAQELFMHKGVTIQTKKFSYHGDIYYIGRKNITFYDYDLKKVIILQKNKIVGEY
jgi:hypothetical protein